MMYLLPRVCPRCKVDCKEKLTCARDDTEGSRSKSLEDYITPVVWTKHLEIESGLKGKCSYRAALETYIYTRYKFWS